MMLSRCTLSVSRRLAIRSVKVMVVTATSRNYNSTPVLLKKKKDEEVNMLNHPEYPDTLDDSIQLMNLDITQEEAEKMIEEELANMEAERIKKLHLDWKPGERKRPLQVSYRLEDFENEGLDLWNNRKKRSGGLAIKVGMMPVWDDWGERHPCTVLFMDSNIVVGHKTMEHNGYSAVQIGAGERKRKNVPGPVLGQLKHLPALYEAPPYLMREFRITDEAHLIPIGTALHARHFVPGQNIDIAGISKGKGFQGGMKRHGFSGMPASHGTSLSHRAIGSVGSCQDPGKVFKGKKMPGRMGGDRVTVQNARILKIDRGRDLLYVRGAIPGPRGAFVEVRDAIKRPLWGTSKVLEGIKSPPLSTFEFDERDGNGEPGFEEFMPLPLSDPMMPNDDQVAA